MLDATAAEILVVDDTPANLKLLVNLLTEQRYRVRPASSGALALRSVTAKPPDLILLDVRMPDLDGYAVCQRLKADPQTRVIPVIFISALNEVTDKIQGFAAGGVDYITKPFEPAEVLARVKTHLELRCLQQHLEQRVEARTAELVEVNRALQQSKEKFHTLFENASDAIFLMQDGRFIDCNVRALEMFGCRARDQILGHPSYEFSPPFQPNGRDSRGFALEKLTAAVAGRPQFFEWTHTKLDGTPFPAEVSLNSVEVGGQVLLQVIVRDITERKQAEEVLRESEEFRRRVFDSQRVPIVVMDIATTQFIDCNPAAVEIYRFASRKETLGKTPLEVSAPVQYDGTPSPEKARFYIEKARAEGSIVFEWRHQRPDGEVWDAEVYLMGFRLGQREFLQFTLQDITARKRAEQELQRYREHLEELVAERTAELRRAMNQLLQTEKLAALGQLVAGVAHELNTPLGNTRTVASALGEELGAFAAAVESGNLRRSQVETFLNRGREAVDLLERNAARAADLISHFKQVAVDQTSMRRRRFDLRQTVEEVLTTLQPQFKHTAHRFEVDIPAHLELDSYPGPLEQVITNLVSNSLIHGFEGVTAGVIQIHAASLGADQVRLDYTDNGVGIPEKILNRLFEPFFTTKLGHGGSGLGLYIVYNLVTGVLGGTMQASGQPGHGATFTLILPRLAPAPSILVTPT